MQNRRELLQAGAQVAAAGLVVGLTGREALAAASRSGARPDQAAWRELRRSLSPAARLLRPGEPGYARLAPPWNLRYAGRRGPAGIVMCAVSKDVQAALRWAAKHDLPLAPRSGGHNYAGHCTTPGLLVHLRGMDEITRRGDRLWVCGGATNSDVYRAGVGRTGLYFPGGRCPEVGVAGLTLGGGLGFNDRKWGLTCDRLVETEVVLADGTAVRASEHENADLYWACRGGAGGNFGVNTGFLFDAVPVSHLIATSFDLAFDSRHGVALLGIVQELLDRDHAGDLDVRFAFFNRGGTSREATIGILGQHLGDEDACRRVLAPLLALRPSKEVIRQSDFWTAQRHLSMPGEREAMASRSLAPDRWLTPDTAEAVVEWARSWRPGVRGNTGYVTLFAMGGRTARLDPHETAFPHRNATFIIDVGASWSPTSSAETVRSLLHQTTVIHRHLIHDLDTSAAYVNFPDPDLRDWRSAYYGDNYDRLVAVKRRYDPDRVFHYPQGIGS